jgi:carbon storage regulator CsrA
MLILARKKEERVFIDTGTEKIVITVVEIRGSHLVRLGIEATPEVRIDREEVAVEREKQLAATGEEVPRARVRRTLRR